MKNISCFFIIIIFLLIINGIYVDILIILKEKILIK